ncbi:lipocalin family protein [Mucilaginibacter dorajii]|jgi:apolipoprotein D and lipocalin family protein|uniref:Lipocalin family protein n=1 Tax=Mucilaginibacter dorajii TaxID=692994 RepID=A0ABP7P4A1_9SPHI|nr:lipocalin family protein [Mucilaginibacter dorajii]MCS3734396.1 apolipoprotein D and lipocalin family protein [Mucilaginibacter dorajii]
MKKEILATSVALGLTALALHAAAEKPLKTVNFVDIKKYLGTWFEIAAFPQPFEKGCSCTSATYGLNADGSVIVKNRCIKDNKLKVTEGKAWITDKGTNSKLAVQFFWPFKGKYWIIDLAKDYSYAVVGHPNRRYLWILSRRPTLDDQTYNQLVVRAANKGFDVRQLVKTEQIGDFSGI